MKNKLKKFGIFQQTKIQLIQQSIKRYSILKVWDKRRFLGFGIADIHIRRYIIHTKIDKKF